MEWQTWWTQNPLVAIPCRFKSDHRHHLETPQIRFLSGFGVLFIFIGIFRTRINWLWALWRIRRMRSCRKNIQDCVSGGHLRIETQVRINIAGCTDVTVSQPLLNLFEAHSVSIQQACATVPKIVKTNLTQEIVFQNEREMWWNIIWLDPFSYLIHINVVEIFFAIRVAT